MKQLCYSKIITFNLLEFTVVIKLNNHLILGGFLMNILRNVFILLLSFIVVTACSQGDEPAKEEQTNEANAEEQETDGEEQEAEEESGIEVDKGLLNVEVTLPEMLFVDEDIDEVLEEAKEAGAKDIKENDDGSVTFKISKKDHKQMMKEMAADVEESVEEMINDEEFVSIKDISFNKNFSEFTMVVDREGFENSFDGFAVFGLGLSGMFYQLFNGDDMDKSKVTVLIEDEATGEVFEEVNYPEALDEMDEE